MSGEKRRKFVAVLQAQVLVASLLLITTRSCYGSNAVNTELNSRVSRTRPEGGNRGVRGSHTDSPPDSQQPEWYDFSFSHLAPQQLPKPDEVGQGNGASGSSSSALSLRECSLGDAGVAQIGQSPWVVGGEGVRALSLRHNQVTAAGSRSLFEALRSSGNDRLSCLELDFNPLGDAGVQPLPAFLNQRAGRGGGGLEELSLRFCSIGPAGCRYLASSLAKSASAAAAAGNSGESHTRCAHVSPEDDEGDYRSGPLRMARGNEDTSAAREAPSVPPCGIRRLLLCGNRLGVAGARALASALKKDNSVELLDLTRCHIGDEGARYIADALGSNTCLRELRLGYNDISAEGASALASLLRGGPGTLHTLELAGNRVGDIGAAAIALGLARPVGGESGKKRRADVGRPSRGSGLRRLGLSGNTISCVGACALAKALGSRAGDSVMEELDLAGNALTSKAAAASEASTKSSLYKSAGGALSSLLTQFVDESYYRTDASAANLAAQKAPLRCGISALATALRSEGCPLRVLGLARTGLSDKDALRLATAIHGRGVQSPLQTVEVDLNGLGQRTVQAVQRAVESPTGAPGLSDGSDATEDSYGDDDLREGRSMGVRRTERWRGLGTAPRVTSRLKATERANLRAMAKRVSNDAGGDVKLEVFGQRVASFRQSRGSATSLDVEVLGKRVRFEHADSSARARRSVPPGSRATTVRDEDSTSGRGRKRAVPSMSPDVSEDESGDEVDIDGEMDDVTGDEDVDHVYSEDIEHEGGTGSETDSWGEEGDDEEEETESSVGCEKTSFDGDESDGDHSDEDRMGYWQDGAETIDDLSDGVESTSAPYDSPRKRYLDEDDQDVDSSRQIPDRGSEQDSRSRGAGAGPHGVERPSSSLHSQSTEAWPQLLPREELDDGEWSDGFQTSEGDMTEQASGGDSAEAEWDAGFHERHPRRQGARIRMDMFASDAATDNDSFRDN